MGRILFITNDFPPQSGGIQTFIEGLIRELPLNSVVVHAPSYRDKEAEEKCDQKFFDELGVVVVRDRRKLLLPTPGLLRRVAGTAHAHDVKQVVFGASVPLGLLAPALRRRGATNAIAITHGHEVWWSKLFPFSVLLRRVAKSVDYLTYLGDFTAQSISRAIRPQDRSKLVHLPPGVDINFFQPGEKPEVLMDKYSLVGKKVILCVGRLVQRKGQDQLIVAMPELLKRHPDVHLLIVGGGNYKNKLVTLAQRLRVDDHVTFAGRIEYAELPAHFRLASIFASPTRDRFGGLEIEGLGIVYLEASASGVAVIAGKDGGSPDAVIDGTTGLIVDGKDSSAITHALDELLTDAAKCAQMGAAGRAWMERDWSWEVIGKRFRSLLHLN